MSLIPLPIDPLIPEIVSLLSANRNLILTATPGAGKTTRLPPHLVRAVSGKIALLEPRRMATVAACHRVAEETGWSVGGEVGYQVRFDGKMSARTKILFMTDALMLRRLSDDPELNEFDLIVLDEFHERNLNQDLILGCVRELQELGSKIKLLIMSATLDVGRLLEFLPGAKHIDVPGKVFPLSIRHFNQPLRLQTDNHFYDRLVGATISAAQETRGDVLVFLPGVGEISRVGERLQGHGLKRDIVSLHGSLPLNQQNEVLRAPQRPRVILSTNVAEASVTVQGVDFVIDSGLAKVMEMNPGSGFSSLELTRIAQFNARQRAGRAAREKAGVCLRLWTSHEEATRAEQMPPECQRSDLSSALLLLSHLGVTNFSEFAWLDRPSTVMLEIAESSLRSLGAIDSAGRLTELGRRLIQFPLPPRWGALLARSEEQGIGKLGARLSALLNERDFVDRAATTEFECDVIARLALLEEIQNREKGLGVNFNQVRAVLDSAQQLERLLKNPGRIPPDLELSVRRLLLTTQTDRLCRRRGTSERGLMVGGRGVRLDTETQVRASEFFLALQGVDLPGKNETSIGLACGLSKSFLLENLPDQVEESIEIDFIEGKGQFFSRRVRRVRGLALEEPSLTPVDPGLVTDRLAEILVNKWDWLATQNEGLGRWLKRWKFFVRLAPEYSGHLAKENIAKAMSMAAFGKTKMSDVIAADLVSFLEMSVEATAVQILRKEAPEKFHAPSGQSHRIQYEEDAAYVDVRLQEIFGVIASPRLVFGKYPLTFRLLGPNYRPVQVTSDLAGFWKTAYVEVRKELRARYPKHSWPDDPLNAKPEAKGRRRE